MTEKMTREEARAYFAAKRKLPREWPPNLERLLRRPNMFWSGGEQLPTRVLEQLSQMPKMDEMVEIAKTIFHPTTRPYMPKMRYIPKVWPPQPTIPIVQLSALATHCQYLYYSDFDKERLLSNEAFWSDETLRPIIYLHKGYAKRARKIKKERERKQLSYEDSLFQVSYIGAGFLLMGEEEFRNYARIFGKDIRFRKCISKGDAIGENYVVDVKSVSDVIDLERSIFVYEKVGEGVFRMPYNRGLRQAAFDPDKLMSSDLFRPKYFETRLFCREETYLANKHDLDRMFYVTKKTPTTYHTEPWNNYTGDGTIRRTKAPPPQPQ